MKERCTKILVCKIFILRSEPGDQPLEEGHPGAPPPGPRWSPCNVPKSARNPAVDIAP